MEIIEQLKSHRSIRKYTDQPVEEGLLQEILEAGIRASSSGNMNVYSIIVTRDQTIRQKLFKPHMYQQMVLEAPVLLTFCADFNRMRKWLKLNAANDSFDNFMSFMVAAIDAILVSQYTATAAESKGLGICYLGSTLANCDQIGEILKLPGSVVPVAGFTLGYPAEEPEIRDRLPLHGLVHQETYHNYNDEEIMAIYQNRETRGWDRYMKIARLKKMVEENKVENLAQIYSQIKYTKQSHREYSQTILEYLLKQDFMNN